MSASIIPIRAAVLGLLVTTAVAVWSLRPLRSSATAELTSTLRSPEPAAPATTPTDRVAALDVRAFDAPLWVAPPAPPPPPAPAPPPPPLPPLRLQLVAIVSEPAADGCGDAVLSVLFYDPDADKLVTLKAGDRIGGESVGGTGAAATGRTIQAITTQAVTIREGASTRVLALRDDAGNTVGGAR